MKPIRFTLRFVIATVALAQLVSCSSMSPANKSLYALDAGRPNAPRDSVPARQASSGVAGVSRDETVQVRRVNIAPPFDGSSLVSRTRGGTYVRDYYNEWVVPPAELFSNQLVDWLSASGPFAAAVDGQSAAPHRYALETSITSLYGDFQDPGKPKVVLAARVYLLDNAAGNRVAFQNHYAISMPLDGASPRELILGAGRAYRELLESITRDLTTYRRTDVAENTNK
jgi:uncharacterized lipoprotein YmbA